MGEFETTLLAELRLGIPPTFYFRLVEVGDHWAFILKMHSFFEGALVKLLREKLQLRPKVRETLYPGDSFPTKVHLASRMNLLESDYTTFLLALNRLRNDITHNIRFIAFDFNTYVDSLSEFEFRRTAAALHPGFKNTNPRGFFPKTWAPKNRRSRQCHTAREMLWHLAPKFSLWSAGLRTLDLISLHFHFEVNGDEVAGDPDIEAKLQDLLHDPAVLAFRLKLSEGFPNPDDCR
jgi:hypothetical protein